MGVGPWCFGPFVLDEPGARLLRDGQIVELPPRPFAVLVHLVSHAGMLLSRDMLLDAIWGHRHVSDAALKVAINAVRAALEDDPKAPLYVETVPRRGYRFVCPVGALHAGTGPSGRVLLGEAAGGNLPTPASTLVDRDQDAAKVLSLLRRHRLVTIAGPGGIGKTALALKVGSQLRHQFTDGAWLVRIDGLSDPLALVPTVARELLLPIEAGRSAEALASALRGLTMLLVLDNCEHLADATATMISAILAASPGVRLLVTSQEPLHVAGEQLQRLGPLGCPPPAARRFDEVRTFGACALFIQRVCAQDGGFSFDDAAAAATAEICRALDGLPLAIELAAARVPSLGIAGVRARLDERLALLTQGPRDAAPRHRTLRATLAWSHGLLPPVQRQVLRRLSVFRGTFSLEAAQMVAVDRQLDRWGVIDALAALIDRSLLVTSVTETGKQRLAMFDSIRAFALEQLDAAGELEGTLQRHAHGVLGLLRTAAVDEHDMTVLEWTARLVPDLENVRAALGYAVGAARRNTAGDTVAAGLALELSMRSVLLWHRAGMKHEAARWHRAVAPLAQDERMTPVLRAGHARAQAVLVMSGERDDAVQALRALQWAAGADRGQGDHYDEYLDLYLQAMLLQQMGREADIEPLRGAMLALEREDWGLMRRRYARWLPALSGGDAEVRQREASHEAYRQACLDELERAAADGARPVLWRVSIALALAEHDRGHGYAAIVLLQRAAHELRHAGQERCQSTLVSLLAAMLMVHGCLDEGARDIEQAIACLRMQGMLWWIGPALPFVAFWQRRLEDAARLAGWADAMLRRRGEQPGPFFAGLLRRIEALVHPALAPGRWAACNGEGERLDEDAALSLAFIPPLAGSQGRGGPPPMHQPDGQCEPR